MSYPERKQIESNEEGGPDLHILVKHNDPDAATAKNGSPRSARLDRVELATLGWEARRARLSVK